MDPNQRKRKAPPLPKFQQPKIQDPKVVQKVADFLQQISKQVSSQQPVQPIQKPTTLATPSTTTSNITGNDGDKKKFNMASLNSKLNSIMSNKKIDLNKVVQSSKKAAEHQTKHRRDIQIQYDPANPNSYQQSKSHYTQIFNKLKMNNNGNQKVDDIDQKISKMIGQFQRNGSEIEQQYIEQPMQQQQRQVQVNKLDDRQSLALRMMQKYGFKIGQGLGKQSQGIKTPLTIKKLTDSSCRIQPSALSLANFVTIQQSAQNALLAFKIQKTQVIALRVSNMQLHQLNDQVQFQIRQQCQKYGKIEEWLTYSTNQGIIFFCKYHSVQQAFKAFTRLNGRYYDQKIINVFFYSTMEFQNKNFNKILHHVVQF